MICACARALRSIVSRPRAWSSLPRLQSPQQRRPAQDRVQRRAQLVRQRREELVLEPADALGFLARRALRFQRFFAFGLESASPP